jgi:hypothetical protein
MARFTFMRALERAHPDIAKKIKEKASGRSPSKVDDLKINKSKTPSIGKTSGPGSIFSRVIEETEKYKDDDRAASLVRGVVKKDAKALKDHHTPKSTKAKSPTPKKKEKKPLSLGAAAINV